MQFAKEKYNLGDTMPKLAGAVEHYKTGMEYVNDLKEGNSYRLDFGNNQGATVTKIGPNRVKVGSTEMAIDSQAFSDLLAKDAINKPTQWLFDYNQGGQLFRAAHGNIAAQMVGAVQPFLSWSAKAAGWGENKSLVNQILNYGQDFNWTNDPAVLAKQAKQIAKVGARRAVWLSAVSNLNAQQKGRERLATSKFANYPPALVQLLNDPDQMSVMTYTSGNPLGPQMGIWAMLQSGAGWAKRKTFGAGELEESLKKLGMDVTLSPQEQQALRYGLQLEAGNFDEDQQILLGDTARAFLGAFKHFPASAEGDWRKFVAEITTTLAGDEIGRAHV